jgi:DNA-binding IclR family transcriptional regulator
MTRKSGRLARSGAVEKKAAGKGRPKGLPGSQTLVRGPGVLEAEASGATNLLALADILKLNRSTTHRLAATLVEHRYLSFTPRAGYALGPKLLELDPYTLVGLHLGVKFDQYTTTSYCEDLLDETPQLSAYARSGVPEIVNVTTSMPRTIGISRARGLLSGS